MPPPPPNPPLSYTTHPSLSPDYNIPVSTWVAHHDSHLCVGVGVLHHATTDPNVTVPRILLIQRAPSEAFGHRWEIPGGSAELQEPTLFASAGRELYEETGLRVTAFTSLLGSYTWIDKNPDTGEAIYDKDGRCKWLKVSFVADVEDSTESGGEPPQVTLDPDEHQAFVWASEEEVRAGKVGVVNLFWLSDNQRADVLRAFEIARAARDPPCDYLAFG